MLNFDKKDLKTISDFLSALSLCKQDFLGFNNMTYGGQ